MKPKWTNAIWCLFGFAFFGGTWLLGQTYPTVAWGAAMLGIGLAEVIGYRRGFAAGRQHEADAATRRQLGILSARD